MLHSPGDSQIPMSTPHSYGPPSTRPRPESAPARAQQDTREAKTLALLFLQSCLGYNLRRASRALSSVLDYALKPTGLRGTQIAILATLDAGDAPSVARMAAEMAMDPSTLLRGLQPLIRTGLVELVDSERGPARIARLTPSGRTELDRALRHWRRENEDLVNRFGADRWLRLCGELAAVVELTRPQLSELPLAARSKVKGPHQNNGSPPSATVPNGGDRNGL